MWPRSSASVHGPQGRAYWAWVVHERGPPLAAVARRPWSAPSPKGAHPLQAVGSARGGEAGLTHRLHLLPAKGRPASRRSIFSRRTSPSIVSSPTLALSRAFSSSRSSAGRALSAASPPRRNASRQAESRAAVRRPTRGRASARLSPRKRRRTASRLRWQENRPRSLRCPGALAPFRPTGALRQSPLLLLFVHRDTPFSMRSWINRVSNKTLERGKGAFPEGKVSGDIGEPQ